MTTGNFTRPALVCNSQSGSHDDAVLAEIVESCRAAGAPLVAVFALPDDEIPDAGELVRQGIDLLLVWTGDGTINAAATGAAGWDGAILPLPGGTLNLLSKKLHGDRPVTEILTDALQGKARRQPVPMIRSDDGDAFITIVAGPATQWAEVRETMRQDGLIEASRSAPDALDAMINAPGVAVAGHGRTYPAIILTPTAQGIRADGILTEGTADVLRHGLAWLGGDFRDGPSEAIISGETIILESGVPISLEYDGELGETPSPARFGLAASAVDFVATA
ncbi:diacylglycerol kinase family protein [Sphingopyxis sp. SE2]|jgi:diacylglycerol kinase family enzyme|uniref:diacylglycerol/lipid kinase family protein n=1 Tax=unclassified Sphingopyxis TaxID=2614943 RepID=UPI000510778C|nr:MULTISPECIES: diacylglycerol kinase family protein [unclassified Sphingopyxis]KGB56530.1 Sphingosine kinase [Sphingopyxis sp. LC363]MDT7529356.1 diacylglycerol kinase family protein [Sphingopyxis sp. SE2]